MQKLRAEKVSDICDTLLYSWPTLDAIRFYQGPHTIMSDHVK